MLNETQVSVDVVLANLLQTRNNGNSQQTLLINGDGVPLSLDKAIKYCQKLKEDGKVYLPTIAY